MRTNAHLYDTRVHYQPAWNHPAPPKYAEDDRVVTFKGEVGVIRSILRAPPTSGMRCREHHYYVSIPGKDQALLGETGLQLATA